MRLGEVLAETVRIYGARAWAGLTVGLTIGGSYLLTLVVPLGVQILVLAAGFTLGYAVASRLVVGDSLVDAGREVAARAPVLLALTVAVSIPFVLSAPFLLLLVAAAAWIAFVGLAIPAAMVEGLGVRDALGRGIALARAEFLHAFGIVAALVVIYVLIGQLLAVTLVGFADNRGVEAVAIVQVILAPFFFYGLTVLYFEQRARLARAPARSR